MKRLEGLLALIALASEPVMAEAQVPMAAPSPPPANAVAPKLTMLSPNDAEAALSNSLHCELRVGSELRLVASEAPRQAIAVIDGSISTMRHVSSSSVRYGGRFVPSPAALEVWIAVDPSQDRSLARGLPRNVTVIVNGATGGSEAYPATYTCTF